MIWKTYKALRNSGVVSINQRNADYVLKYNERSLYPLVDNKLETKVIANKANIAVPKLYFTVTTEHDIPLLESALMQYQDFAIKPACGSGGDGILVITDRVRDYFRKTNGALLKYSDIAHHLSNILSGMHSLGGHADCAIIEYRVKVDPVFSQISYQGVPDIRIITLLGYPVMGMLRLPTRLSDGKANLHQGAIGVGLDLATGKTLGGVWHNETIDFHPDTMHDIAGVQIPYWDQVLDIAARCYDLTGLGYIGVDIVLDSEQGPLMLELNARPGLNIQIANREGLGKRLAQIEGILERHPDPADRIAYIKSAFARSV